MVEFEFIKTKPQGFPTISVLKGPPKWTDRKTQDKILSFIAEPDKKPLGNQPMSAIIKSVRCPFGVC